jgi:hypothetical protein
MYKILIRYMFITKALMASRRSNSIRSCVNVKTFSGQTPLFSFRRIDIYSLSISRNLGTVWQLCDSSGSLKWRQQQMPLALMMQDANRLSGRILNLTLL